MACCSPTDAPQAVLDHDPEIDRSAGRLAKLLSQTPEYQEYQRLGSLLNLDRDVGRLSFAIRRQSRVSVLTPEKSIEELQAELQSLPAVHAYRKAESRVKELFRAVDAVISSAAGVEFAPNAVTSGCG